MCSEFKDKSRAQELYLKLMKKNYDHKSFRDYPLFNSKDKT